MSGDPSPAKLPVEPSSTTCGPAHQVLRHPGILSRMSHRYRPGAQPTLLALEYFVPVCADAQLRGVRDRHRMTGRESETQPDPASTSTVWRPVCLRRGMTAS
jgi:hypothetical protein